MSEPYLITFAPVGPYYFGSSQSWDEGFHAVSRRLPTQMTILGCLRFNLLKKKGWLEESPTSGRFYPNKKQYSDEIATLTGTSDGRNLHSVDTNLGIIKSLSPVFLVQQNSNKIEDFLVRAPADVVWENEDKKVEERKLQILTPHRKNKGKSFVRNQTYDFVIHTTYNPKIDPPHYWGGRNFWTNYFKGEQLTYNPEYLKCKLFHEESQVGIAREDRVAKDGAFYRKDHFRLAPGIAFGVIVHLESTSGDPEDLLPQDGIVQLGGEQSKFRFEVTRVQQELTEVIQNHPILKIYFSGTSKNLAKNESTSRLKFVALSPILHEPPVNELEFAIIPEIEAIRVLKAPRRKDTSQRKHTGRKTDMELMIPAQSVFYSSEEFEMKFKNNFASTIGFNLITTIGEG